MRSHSCLSSVLGDGKVLMSYFIGLFQEVPPRPAPPAISPAIFPIIERKTPWGPEACVPTASIITSDQLEMAAHCFCLQRSRFLFWNCRSFSPRHFLDDVSNGIRPRLTVKAVFFPTPCLHDNIISIFTIRGCTPQLFLPGFL